MKEITMKRTKHIFSLVTILTRQFESNFNY